MADISQDQHDEDPAEQGDAEREHYDGALEPSSQRLNSPPYVDPTPYVEQPADSKPSAEGQDPTQPPTPGQDRLPRARRLFAPAQQQPYAPPAGQNQGFAYPDQQYHSPHSNHDSGLGAAWNQAPQQFMQYDHYGGWTAHGAAAFHPHMPRPNVMPIYNVNHNMPHTPYTSGKPAPQPQVYGQMDRCQRLLNEVTGIADGDALMTHVEIIRAVLNIIPGEHWFPDLECYRKLNICTVETLTTVMVNDDDRKINFLPLVKAAKLKGYAAREALANGIGHLAATEGRLNDVVICGIALCIMCLHKDSPHSTESRKTVVRYLLASHERVELLKMEIQDPECILESIPTSINREIINAGIERLSNSNCLIKAWNDIVFCVIAMQSRDTKIQYTFNDEWKKFLIPEGEANHAMCQKKNEEISELVAKQENQLTKCKIAARRDPTTRALAFDSLCRADEISLNLLRGAKREIIMECHKIHIDKFERDNLGLPKDFRSISIGQMERMLMRAQERLNVRTDPSNPFLEAAKWAQNESAQVEGEAPAEKAAADADPKPTATPAGDTKGADGKEDGKAPPPNPIDNNQTDRERDGPSKALSVPSRSDSSSTSSSSDEEPDGPGTHPPASTSSASDEEPAGPNAHP